MDRDTAIGICIDNIELWSARVMDLLNGSTTPDSIIRRMSENKIAKQEAPIPTSTLIPIPHIIIPPEKFEKFDVNIASRDELVLHCIRLGYSTLEVKGKRINTLKQMVQNIPLTKLERII